MKHKFLLFLIGLILLVSVVSAVPTTTAVNNITAGQATFHGTGGVSPCWFSWGYGTNLYWTTPNQTVSGGFADTQTGSPMLSGVSYNVKACDSTGCGNVVSFAVPKATMINATHFGTAALTIMRSGFNVYTASTLVITPYAQGLSGLSSVFTTGAASWIWGIFFAFIFIGYWLRGKGIMMPAILAIMAGTVIVASPIQVDPMFISMGFPLLAIGLAGVFVSWISNK
jgi:hypothetical protein